MNMVVKENESGEIVPEGLGYAKRLNQSLPIIICVFLPFLILIGAYIHMAFRYEKLWLFNTIVHERGKYTLLEVIFYFRHFLWEVPIKMIYSLLIVGLFFYYGKPVDRMCKSVLSDNIVRRILFGSLVVFGIIIVAIFMTAKAVGLREALIGLLQYRTHELRPIQLGSHWRNHFLSNIVLFSSTAFMIILYRIFYGGAHWIQRKFAVLLPISIAIFIFLTIIFGFTMDPFETPTYLGHQLREVFGSDLSITMLLSVAVLLFLEKKYNPYNTVRRDLKQKNRKKVISHLTAWFIPMVIISGYLIMKVLTLDVSSEISQLGDTGDWSVLDLFAWHFYEHCLDYILIVSLIYVIYLLTLRTEAKRIFNEK